MVRSGPMKLDTADGRAWELTRDPWGQGPGGQQAGTPYLHFRAKSDPIFGEWRRWDRSPVVLKRMIEAGGLRPLERILTIRQDVLYWKNVQRRRPTLICRGHARVALGAYLASIGHPGGVAMMVSGSEEAAGRAA